MEDVHVSMPIRKSAGSSSPSTERAASIRSIEAVKEREEILLGLLRFLARVELRRCASDTIKGIFESGTK